jgi:hypothetical protein
MQQYSNLGNTDSVSGLFLTAWLRDALVEADTEGVIVVDGKTAKCGLDENGRPLHMLNVFVHDVQVVIGQ